MKQDTKEKLGMVALVGVGLYVLTRDSDKGYAGGFGGGGGIPLLPGDTEGAAEGDTIINYILPKPDVFDGFDPAPAPDTKKDVWAGIDIGIKPLEYYSAGGVSVLSEHATPAQKVANVMSLQHYRDPVAVAFSGRTEGIDLWGKKGKDVRILGGTKESTVKVEGGAAWYNPFAWNWSEAAENYQAWSTRSTERTLGRDPSSPKSGAADVIATSKKVSTSRSANKISSVKTDPGFSIRPSSHAAKYRDTSTSSASRGYSLMGASTRHAPGWKQIGAKKPTAPGQPDRY